MKLRTLTVRGAMTAALALSLAAPALARNMHCAGGIQYVVQGLRDKDKGNTEDYLRQMNKAVEQLNTCATEDPKDFEALGYLGWAYAELDSAGPAGVWFDKAVAGLSEGGDKKKLDMVATNRESYWAKAFNDGIRNIQDAQQAYSDYSKEPSADEKPLKDEATAKYEAAIASLTRAKLLKPASAMTLRNLGTAYALMGRYDEAEAVLRNGLTEAASDTSVGQLGEALRMVRSNKAGGLLDAKKYDEAIVYYQELSKQEPGNSDHFMGMANALFSRAQGSTDAAKKKADYKAAGEAYAKASALKPTDGDLAFNTALSFQNAQEWASAEGAWRKAIELKPEEVDAKSSLGAVLAEQSKYEEAAKTVHAALAQAKPDNVKNLYRQLGAIYSRAGANAKATELLTLYLAMNQGTMAPEAAAAAGALKGVAATTLGANGTPDQVWNWKGNGSEFQSWFYFAKKLGFTFDPATGALVQKSDWGTPGAIPAKK